ncbi:C4-dicarboxylate anaerobic carrier, arginine transporter [Lentilactobacillus otakiensis DSM 19908 = JCM 15040]|uniref:C4-dicarboxylate anaerobic carrier, arginine transporter n=1 Tax=Lentilactobacillus otakiensis DSM 19908 = JCM 15040 TaxID=1423780 RepID=S4NIK1_9LACO|nr:YfcC family protein [Lentilactobacillus otakiensis]KRL12038.1 C4-dicarboxylate anaerobic carrier, arginine transporter [Lentilactobacillus otakiensis DSM 19908 = JCM 15040]MBZ3776525.1 YfcC family protein [Lentilactobacillus otakiensis]MDV3517374.1 YfcC family protein [Lentilactobacillus otakiensis]GAD17072.1 C4-dicarboxylate anaerobic carrier, arginine transporter [Lentilactobacillus otakiensis DSM 19908 = JCM 15040]
MNNPEPIKKHRFKMPSAFTILFGIIIFIAVMTWVIPAGTYNTTADGTLISGTYHTVASHTQGLWDVLMAPIIGMIGNKATTGAIEISIFILVIGGFLGVVNKTGALDDGIRAIVHRYTGHEKRLIIILMILFSAGGSTYGMGEETMAFFPLLIPIMMGVGYDSLVAVGIILLSTRVGDLASTVNPFATGVASGIIKISPGVGLFSRVILLVIVTAMAIWFVIHYAEKVKKDPTKSLVYNQRQEDMKRFSVEDRTSAAQPLSKSQKHVLWLFCLTFVIMIVGLIPWTSINKSWTFFNTFNGWITSNAFLGTVLGKDIVPLGNWYFNEITLLFLLMSIVIMFVSHMKEADFISAFMNGMAELLNVAIIVAVARGIQAIMNSGMITGTILHWGESGLSGLPKPVFAILAFAFFCVLSLLIPSSSGLAAATMGIMGSLAAFSHVDGSVMVSAFQAASGLITAITPTSAILMGALALSHVSLAVWWKWTSKLIISLFAVTCGFLAIVAVM